MFVVFIRVLARVRASLLLPFTPARWGVAIVVQVLVLVVFTTIVVIVVAAIIFTVASVIVTSVVVVALIIVVPSVIVVTMTVVVASFGTAETLLALVVPVSATNRSER